MTGEADRPAVPRDEAGLIVFGGCDYLGLSRHPRVVAAAAAGLDEYGISVSASRSTTGDTAAHRRLVARFVRHHLGEIAGQNNGKHERSSAIDIWERRAWVSPVS